MKLVVSLALALLATTASAAPETLPRSKYKGINYSAEFYAKADCKGRKTKGGEHKNFGCSEICWPSEGVHSVRLKAKEYKQMPWYKLPDSEEYHNEGFGGKYQYVETEGPIALAYSDAECNAKSFMARAFIPKGNETKCVTFEQPVYGWSLKLLKKCTFEELKAIAEVDVNNTAHEWYQPHAADMDKVRAWEEFNRDQRTHKEDVEEDYDDWNVVWPPDEPK